MLFGVEQPVQMNDDVAHLSVIDGALRGGSPSLFGQFIIGIHADKVERAQILELQMLRILDPTTEYQMQFAHARPFLSRVISSEMEHFASRKSRETKENRVFSDSM